MNGLSGKRAIVCGASQGLGRAVAEALARYGATVAVCARSGDALAAVADGIEGAGFRRPFTHTFDLLDARALDAFVQEAREELGGIDVVVNNTGGPRPGTFDELGDEDFQHAFELVFLSNVRITRAALPALRASGSGVIVNILSSGVLQPIPGLMLSNALRLGIVGLSKTLADEVANDGVRVVNVCPRSIHTPRVDALIADTAERLGIDVAAALTRRVEEIPLGRLGTPAEFAEVVAFVASDAASFLTGVTIPVDGGAVRSSL